jgi:hypothetical protein
MDAKDITPDMAVHATFPKGHWLHMVACGIPNPTGSHNFTIKEMHVIMRDGNLACACTLPPPKDQFIYSLEETKHKHRDLLCTASKRYVKNVVLRENREVPG